MIEIGSFLLGFIIGGLFGMGIEVIIEILLFNKKNNSN